MGVVYRARHVLIDRVVALKLIRPDLRGETHLRAWMLREARAANRVDHAHIVDIYDVGETDESELYLVMEYLTGIALSHEIAKGKLEVSRAVDILEQMCAALTRAHDLGVVHRDLKSDNIMLTLRGGRKDFVKILDFGLAALARDPRLAPKGAVFGTPEYMSPEQARGEDAQSSSDLYALGVLFYEMLTGQLPFRSSDRDELLEMQRKKEAPPLKPLRQDIPDKAELLCLKLLEKKPADRYKDGHHLRDDLKALQRAMPTRSWEVVSSEAVPAAPPPPPPARTAGVLEWSKRAANFLRATSRAYPNGGAPEKVSKNSKKLWDVAAEASRLEGELSSLSRKLEAIEKRGRGLRAEIGRKVEELAKEMSQAQREADSQRNHSDHYESQRVKAVGDLSDLEKEIAAGSAGKEIWADVGSAKARIEVLTSIIGDHSERAQARDDYSRELQTQINELKDQLQRYSDALESDLAAGRERIATRVQRALALEKDFMTLTGELFTHLHDRPECRELLDSLSESGVEKPVELSATL